MDTPQNETPPVLSSGFNSILQVLGDYGWHIVFLLVIANLIYSHLKPKFQKWQDRRNQQQQEVEYTQNPEKLISMQESLLLSRQRLQEQQDQIAEQHAAKLKKAEEERLLAKRKKWESVQTGSSYRETKVNDSSAPDRPKPSARTRLRGEEYNPLMGSSGTCFRSSRRGTSGG